MISRDTSGEAWAEAARLLDDLDDAEIANAQRVLGASESVGQDRMRQLHSAYRTGGAAPGRGDARVVASGRGRIRRGLDPQ